MTLYDLKQFEQDNPNLEMFYSDPYSGVQVFLNPKDHKFYARGPFGRWDADCYQFVGHSLEELMAWVNAFESTFKIKKEATFRKF